MGKGNQKIGIGIAKREGGGQKEIQRESIFSGKMEVTWQISAIS